MGLLIHLSGFTRWLVRLRARRSGPSPDEQKYYQSLNALGHLAVRGCWWGTTKALYSDAGYFVKLSFRPAELAPQRRVTFIVGTTSGDSEHLVVAAAASGTANLELIERALQTLHKRRKKLEPVHSP